MPDFNQQRLQIYENSIDDVAQRTDTSHGDDVFPSFRETVAVDDGYREADYVIEITIDNERETRLVLMSSKIEDDERVAVDDINDQEALKRARRYSAEIENGSYYGITDGSRVRVEALDPDTDIEIEEDIEDLGEILNEIIVEERRIKDSNEFVGELREHHEEVKPYTKTILKEKIENDEDFEQRIRDFLVPIGESYDEDEEIPEETLDMLAQQGTYLLVDKILFYYLIRENEENLKESLDDGEYDEVFEELKQNPPSPEEIDEEWAQEFWDYLQEIFRQIQKIDYEPIFDPKHSPLNEISFESEPLACLQLKELMDSLYKKEELSHLFDGPLLSKIYEGLIPPEIRWKWGQIYTPPEVTRLISNWAITDPEDNVLDPACGTGRFLVSAYERLAELKDADIGEKHQEMISQISGFDINQFPAHLATMSLVAMSLESITEEVNIFVRDFFRDKGGGQTNFSPTKSRIEMTGQTEIGEGGDLQGQSKISEGSFDNTISKQDVVLMNPPYTRQEALSDEYKERVRDKSLSGFENGSNVRMGKRASFYSYFITQSTKFLKDSGRLGMIIQNSWLDVDYGKYIQEFLLDNYRIEAIIGSEKERLIKTADVNTVVVLLEREKDEKNRNENEVKFVRLRKDLNWFEKNYGFSDLYEIIGEEENYFGDDLRIVSYSQKELRERGSEDGKYKGGKWGKYLRAPDIYFEIEDQFDKLSDVSEVDYPFKTGANKFFYLPAPEKENRYFSTYEEDGKLILEPNNSQVEDEFSELNVEQLEIEKEFWKHQTEEKVVPNYVIKSPKELDKIQVSENELSNVILLIPEKPKNELPDGVSKFIEWGENHKPARGSKFPQRETCKSRKFWYSLKNDGLGECIVCRRLFNEEFMWPINDDGHFVDQTFYKATFNNEEEMELIAAFLNSSIGHLLTELNGRYNLGEGALQYALYESAQIPILPVSLLEENKEAIRDSFDSLKDREVSTVYEEIGAENSSNVSIDDVKEDRRELDREIMEELLDFDKKEQLEVYRKLITLVKNRISKAESGE